MSAFLVSPFGAAERTWKPFNPVLGETFEAHKLANAAYFLAEQVRGWLACGQVAMVMLHQLKAATGRLTQEGCHLGLRGLQQG